MCIKVVLRQEEWVSSMDKMGVIKIIMICLTLLIIVQQQEVLTISAVRIHNYPVIIDRIYILELAS